MAVADLLFATAILVAFSIIDQLDRVAKEINAAVGRATGLKTDVTKDADVEALMDKTVEFGGSINFVVPSAGIIRDGQMINTDKETGKVKKVMSTDAFRLVMEVNLIGSFIVLREVAKRMVDNGWICVLCTISSVNKCGQASQLNYSSTKVSVALWPKSLAGEFHMKKIKDIRAGGIAPGYVGTTGGSWYGPGCS
ncbi:hypothetical protein AU468_05225 [Alkalispirochaeta sphaeroplastigenens]|uniref:Uncharacterized protein n=1 Tax=Alkalispirochaeta sphaeroplastigenens TaxID=1187066 RepID=A0A2S4JVP7_9SPIO|nr:SDR family NAD(P)-dependent oxidoreductase [Alkalispirochaeta sphaeroplastigenens]POR03563.1 hypothetical protein AU468_05225 [Alkalispirochaeta sphaeroplastigenens]